MDTLEKTIQVVLAGQPTGWTAMAHAVRNFDEEKVKDCKEDVDTLLVFVCDLSGFSWLSTRTYGNGLLQGWSVLRSINSLPH